MAKAGTRSEASDPVSDSERRRTHRAPFVVRVDYGTVDAFFSEFTADVNEGGLFIETEAPQPPGTAVVLQFRIPGSDRPIKVRGRVVWTSAERPSELPGMGIEFENLDVRARERINEVVRQLRAKDLPDRFVGR
jgi:uncharacterized protein (TIGR02266 family)